MPVYNYHCATNGTSMEVQHSIVEDLKTWGEVCEKCGVDPGATPAEAPVERILYAPSLHTPVGNSKLKEQGFAKLVRRDKGVYENVTALDGEKRYMKSDDPTSIPDLKRRIGS